MAKHPIVGIDIGSSSVRIVAAQMIKEEGALHHQVLGIAAAPISGMRYGYVGKSAEAMEGLLRAIGAAKNGLNQEIRRAHLSTKSLSLESIILTGTTVISRADGGVTGLDIDKAIENAEESFPEKENRRILHAIPLKCKLDGKEIHGRAENLHGLRLEVRTLFVSALEQHCRDLETLLEHAGIEVESLSAAPLVAGNAILSAKEKQAGAILILLGSETTSFAVFEDEVPILVKSFPFGGENITNDIAIGLRISLAEAETIKKTRETSGSRRRLEDIIEARLEEILEAIDKELTNIGRNALLPAGAIVAGGGANIVGIEMIVRNILKLPAKTISNDLTSLTANKIKDPSFCVAYGLTLPENQNDYHDSPTGFLNQKFISSLKDFFKQFAP